MAKELDCGVKVSEFELKSLTIYFRTNSLGKGKNALIFQAMLSILSLLHFYKDGIDYLMEPEEIKKKRGGNKKQAQYQPL